MERRVFVQRAMSSRFIVVARVGLQGSTQVSLAQGDDGVAAFAADRSDEPFCDAVLPRRTWGDGLVPDAHCPQSARDRGPPTRPRVATPSPRLRGCARTRTLDRRHASSSAFTRSFDRSFRHYCPQGDRRECRWASATTTTSDISERSTQVSKLMSFMKSCSATPISRSWPNPILMQALCKCIGPRAQALCSEARASFQSGASQVEVTQRTPFPQRSLYAAAPCPIIGVSRARQAPAAPFVDRLIRRRRAAPTDRGA